MATFIPGNESLYSLYQRAKRIIEIPDYQREEVWSLSKNQQLIDSILRGIPIPPIIIQNKPNVMGVKYEIVDGQQRLNAIFGFMRNEYPTAKRNLGPGIKPIESNRFYSDLSQEMRDRFDNFKLPTLEISGDDIDIALAFRRWNSGVMLTFAEKLYSMNIYARDLYLSLGDHNFFKDMFIGSGRRKGFQVLARIILIDKSESGYGNATNPRLEDAIASVPENYKSLERSITILLDNVYHVFYGYQFSSISETTFLCQAVKLLIQDGYNLSKASNGILTVWANKKKEEVNNITFTGNSYNVYRMQQSHAQHKFWDRELPTIREIIDAPLLDRKRLFSNDQKLRAYNKQNGICPICSGKLRQNDIGHHIIAHSNGGMTDDDNCLLMHKDCHDKLDNKVNNQFSMVL